MSPSTPPAVKALTSQLLTDFSESPVSPKQLLIDSDKSPVSDIPLLSTYTASRLFTCFITWRMLTHNVLLSATRTNVCKVLIYSRCVGGVNCLLSELAAPTIQQTPDNQPVLG